MLLAGHGSYSLLVGWHSCEAQDQEAALAIEISLERIQIWPRSSRHLSCFLLAF